MRESQKGQILLITLLVLSVATTVALALVSRSTTDVNISTQVEESSRAFSAAEAGIEDALKQQYTTGLPSNLAISSTDTNTTYTVTHAFLGGSANIYEYPEVVAAGDVATFWLVPRIAGTGDPDLGGTDVANTTLRICWGNESGGSDMAVIAAYYYIESTNNEYRVVRKALIPASDPDLPNFDDTNVDNSGCSADTDYNYSWDIPSEYNTVDTDDTAIMLRVRPVTAAGVIALNVGGDTIPPQGNDYTSCGKTTTGIERCVQVYQQYHAAPAVFDYVLYSSGGSLDH